MTGTLMDALYILSGFAVGTLVGVTGVGGGALMTPLLVLLFGVSPVTAVGTDLLFAAVTKTGGAWVHARRGNVDWKIVRWLAAGSVPGSAATLALLRMFAPNPEDLSTVVGAALGMALILTAGALLFKEELRSWAARRYPVPSVSTAPRTLAVGAVLGALVTLSSVGAGALGVTALLFLYPGLAAARIVGTDIAHAVPLTLVAGLGHAATGSVDWTLLAALLIGSLPGIWLGSSLSRKVPERILSAVLAAMLALVGAKLAF